MAANGYPYPTPEMIAAYTRAVNSGGLPSANGTPVETSMLTAPIAAMQRGFRGFRNWLGVTILGADAGGVIFAPMQPLQPIAQAPETFGPGRAFDYALGINTRVTPRMGAGISFAQLKAFAQFDVLRVMIERLKDRVISQQWSIVPKDEKQPRDARCDEVEDFLAFPDRMHTFDDWSRLLIEQVVVYDAPTLFLHMTRGGDLYALEVIDGSMITPKIGPDGRLPPPQIGPAYQQVIKGMPAVDYIQPVPKGMPVPVDPDGVPFPELLYRPRNPRVDHLYGYGPVEQIIQTIKIATAGEDFALRYYTDGAMPDLIFVAPPTWTSTQIREFTDWFNGLLSGNLGERRKFQMVPGGDGGMKPVDTKEKAILNAELNEWLVRVMAFALGLNPMPFIKMMNKGQEKTHHDESQKEGLEPWLEWFANFMNTIILLKWGYSDVVFRWKEDEATDEATRADIDTKLVNAKIYHPDEIRAKRGDDAMPEAMRMQMDMPTFAATVTATVLPPDQQAEADDRADARAEQEAANAPAPAVAGKLGKGQAARSRSTARGRAY